MKLILLAQLAATWYMVGVIWFVQIVHYRLLDRVGVATFASYAGDNSILTAWAVVPPMLIEVATAALLIRRRPAAIPLNWTLLGMALIVVAWFSTLMLQAPQHLLFTSSGYTEEGYQFLLRTNWIRVAAWSLRGLLVLAMVWRCLAVGTEPAIHEPAA